MSEYVDFIPERGDVIYLNCSPQAGREQKGWRPAVIISPASYNVLSNTALLCPITSNIQPWAWKVMLPEDEPITGAVLVDQCATRDYRARGAKHHGRLSDAVMEDVLVLLQTLTG